ncbi:hypothetical protein PC116_g13497 [Phytophthora cactorum]|nr:hypothetical protein PC116_g13497 [Phytophthora cactorum]
MTTAVVSSSITMLTMHLSRLQKRWIIDSVDRWVPVIGKVVHCIPVRNIWNSTGNLLECFSIRLHLNCINCVIPADANAASTAPVIVL